MLGIVPVLMTTTPIGAISFLGASSFYIPSLCRLGLLVKPKKNSDDGAFGVASSLEASLLEFLKVEVYVKRHDEYR